MDECKLTSCDYGMNCSNTVGSYVCSCLKGFRQDNDEPGMCEGQSCELISFEFLSCKFRTAAGQFGVTG